MPTSVKAYSATSPTSGLAPTMISRRDLGPRDVAIDIHYAGICHSDIHTVRADWRTPEYPVVPGHEITGVVTAIGSEVEKFTPGARVGVGCFVDSCRECRSCTTGLEQYCSGKGMVSTYGGRGRDGLPTYGGYSGAIVVDERYVLRIPAALRLDVAAPLLCAGITMYSPLRHWGAGPGRNVAIVGLGGLGHLGVKLAAAMGADVTVLSQSLKKMEDGLRMGAHRYFSASDPATFSMLHDEFDLVINTVSANLKMGAYLGIVALDGTLVEIGAPPKPLEIAFGHLAMRRRSLSGSIIGGITETQQMLDFCATHAVMPEIEVIEPEYINDAYDRVLSSDVRYRFVIDAASLRN